MKTLVILLGASILLFACSSEENKSERDNSNGSDTTNVDTTMIDTTQLSDDTLKAQGYDIDEQSDVEENLEKKYGEQWEFCDCVVRNDSVNKAIMAEGTTDAQVDQILARMDVIQKHCAKMLTVPNTTPEERNKYQRKVNKCLRQNGLK
jgi:hypothetical protein